MCVIRSPHFLAANHGKNVVSGARLGDVDKTVCDGSRLGGSFLDSFGALNA